MGFGVFFDKLFYINHLLSTEVGTGYKGPRNDSDTKTNKKDYKKKKNICSRNVRRRFEEDLVDLQSLYHRSVRMKKRSSTIFILTTPQTSMSLEFVFRIFEA